jgi:hypothetical protein
MFSTELLHTNTTLWLLTTQLLPLMRSVFASATTSSNDSTTGIEIPDGCTRMSVWKGDIWRKSVAVISDAMVKAMAASMLSMASMVARLRVGGWMECWSWASLITTPRTVGSGQEWSCSQPEEVHCLCMYLTIWDHVSLCCF